jgi:hypothetical protein
MPAQYFYNTAYVFSSTALFPNVSTLRALVSEQEQGNFGAERKNTKQRE